MSVGSYYKQSAAGGMITIQARPEDLAALKGWILHQDKSVIVLNKPAGLPVQGGTKSERNRWDIAFAGGSLIAAMAQGIALGAILQGVHVEGRHYAGGWWDWLTPFSILTGCAVVAGYGLLGATWLVMKTTGRYRARTSCCVS